MKEKTTGFFGRSGRLAVRICACMSVVLVMAVLTAGCGSGKDSAKPEAEAATPAVVEYTTIDTQYCPLRISVPSLEKLSHTEVVENGITKEVFHMLPEDGGRELYQICFGQAEGGTPVGMLQIGDGTVTVSVIVPEYDLSALPEAERAVYGTLMDELNVMLSSIREQEAYRTYEAPKEEPVIAMQTAELTYWTVELPETMDWVETVEAEIYKADFYGMVGQERIHLYTVSLGDTSAQSLLGVYTADGMERVLGITPYTLASQAALPGESQTQAYAQMMDTINTLLPVIMESEGFDPELPQ